VSGTQSCAGAWTFRLDCETEVWVLRSWRAYGWFDILSFALDPQYPIDFAVKNYHTSTHPASPFVRRLVVQRAGDVVQRAGDTERYTLVGHELTVTWPDGTSKRRHVPPTGRPAVLRSLFGIELASDDKEKIISN
jgi:N-hydroxyarylamine O-acetyltransferase